MTILFRLKKNSHDDSVAISFVNLKEKFEEKNNKTVPKDSHKKSLSEAFVNSFGGYPIGYGLGIVILPISVGWIQEDPLTANLAITLVYASVSFVRSYVLRRTFEKYGIEDNFLKIGIKLFKKIVCRQK